MEIDTASQYEERTCPAYDSVMRALVKPAMAKNPFILKWWTIDHDKLIKRQILKSQWYWHFYIRDEVILHTDSSIIEIWKQEDPACKRGIGTNAWYNVLDYFAFARAEQIGLASLVRKPKWKTCPLCDNWFLENSLPEPLARRLGVYKLDFCAPCLTPKILQNAGTNVLTKEEVKEYLRELSSIIQAVPHQGFGEGAEDILYLNNEQRLAVLRLMSDKPSTEHVKNLFISWFHALVESGILEKGARKTSRGTMCLAKDGHMCLSLAEKTLDDFLFNHGVTHTREPHYPNSNYRADFEVKGVYIEYFGLVGNDLYDQKIQEKKKIAKDAGIQMIPIYPNNLLNIDWMSKTLLSIR